jgi:putative flippase GtrA
LSVLGFVTFCISYIPNFLVQVFLVAALTRWLQVSPAVAYLLGVAVGVPVTFLILDRLTFRSRGGSGEGEH